MAAFCSATAAATTAHVTPAPPARSGKHLTSCSSKLRNSKRKPETLQAQALASSAPAPAGTAPVPLNVDYLATEFAGHGATFEAVGDGCAVKMALYNGSVAHLLLPSGLATSYKPAMWHGAATEVLHTTVREGARGQAVIRGGASVDFHCTTDDGELSWSPRGSWALRDVRGSPAGSIQVELVSVAPENKVEARCMVALHPEALASEFTVTNATSSPLQLSSSVENHLRVSTPDATYAVGLQGSDYRCREPMASEFSIIPPDFRKGSARTNLQWASKGLAMVLSNWGSNPTEESDGEEHDNYKHMTAEMCRIYRHAPREFTIIDRGRRNSICLCRRGFEELYVFSPGSNYQWYGQYAYVCVGPAMIEPVILGPGSTWEGAQYLRNPNL